MTGAPAGRRRPQLDQPPAGAAPVTRRVSRHTPHARLRPAPLTGSAARFPRRIPRRLVFWSVFNLPQRHEDGSGCGAHSNAGVRSEIPLCPLAPAEPRDDFPLIPTPQGLCPSLDVESSPIPGWLPTVQGTACGSHLAHLAHLHRGRFPKSPAGRLCFRTNTKRAKSTTM